jgi:hypothetical protein
VGILLGALLIAGCTAKTEGQPTAPGSTVNTTQPTTSTPPVPPPIPEPATDKPCPYLTNAFIADANGQRVGKVRTSADAPHPACFFYRTDGRIQLTARIFIGDPGQAKALVDQVAPVATANPADLPGGWTGGAQSTDTGAVFAVAKAGTAVVISTNQEQTIKAKRVAEKVIEQLSL